MNISYLQKIKSTLYCMKYLDTFIKSAGSWMIAGGLFQAISGFGANVVLARNLEVQDFGFFAVVSSMIGLVALLVNSCAGTVAISSNEADFQGEYKSKLYSILLVELLLIVIISSALLLILNQMNFGVMLYILGTIIVSWSDFQMKFIERHNRFREVSIVETSSELLSHILAVIVLLLGFGVLALYIRLFFKGAIKVGFQVFYCKMPRIYIAKFDRLWLKTYFHNAKHFYTSGMLESGLERIIVLFLGAFSGVKETGFFFQARRLAIVPHQILQPYFFRILFNTFSRDDSYKSAFRELNKNMVFLLILLFLALVLTFTIGHDVIVFTFGLKWAPVTEIIYCLSGIIAASVPFELLKAFYQAKSVNMAKFLYFGRGAQYFCLTLSIIVSLIIGSHYVLILSVGISAGYIIGSMLLYYVLHGLVNNTPDSRIA